MDAIERPAGQADPLADAARVIQAEAEALRLLAAALDERFTAAVEAVANLSGRLIVTGMGKSGHVARKVAATLASTGTPAQFVHPAEAGHGDLGMITAGDGVLALSASGETAELADIIAHCGRFGLPLIGVAGRAGSTLARAADIALVLPKVAEACPHNLAPTTSTIMQMALGDALAVALLRRRGFSAEDFHVFHPRGRLGAQLSRVAQFMHRDAALPLVPLGTRMDAAILRITEGRLGCVAVAGADGRLAGIVTDGDLRRQMGPDLLARPVEQVMTRAPRTIGPDASAAAALHLMNAHRINALVVIDAEQRPLGIVHVQDLLRAGVA
jgi:arabinose-5-phosphate isomerase